MTADNRAISNPQADALYTNVLADLQKMTSELEAEICRRKHAEEALHESEHRFRLAQKIAQIGTFEWNLDSNVNNWTPQLEAMHGLSPGGFPKTQAGWLNLVHPDDRSHAQHLVERSFEVDGPMEGEWRVVWPDGTVRWLAGRWQVLKNGSGHPVRVTGINIDLTDRKRAEQRLSDHARSLEVINRTGSALAGELDLEKLVQAVTDAGRDISGAQFGAFFYNVKNEKRESYMLYTLSGAPREAFSKFPMPRNTALFDPTFKGLGVIRIADVHKDSRYGKNAPHFGMPKGHLPVTSYLAVPVVSRSGEVLGGLFYGHKDPNVFSAESEQVITAIAAHAAIAIDNARLYRAAQNEIAQRKQAEESNARLIAAVENSDDAIITKNLEDIITSWNKAAERIFGYTADEIIGKPGSLLIPKDLQNREPGVLAKLRQGERIDHYETVRQRKDGTLLSISLTVSPILDDTGAIIGTSKIGRDITQRKIAEDRLRRRGERLQLLSDTLAQILRAHDPNSLTHDLFPKVAAHLGVDTYFNFMINNDGDALLLHSCAGIPEDAARAVQRLEFDHAICGAVAQTREAIHATDIQHSNYDRANLARSFGLQCYACNPLIVGERLLGTISFASRTRPAFDDEELQFLHIIAQHVAIALDRLQSAERLEKAVAQRTASLTEAVAQMEEFSYSVSHDLRAPVRAMQGYAQAILDDYGDRLDDQGREFLTHIIRCGARMDRLVLDVLTYSRLARSQVTVQPISIDALVLDIISHYTEMQPPRATVTICSKLGHVLAHEPSLTQAISNLLSNAVKFVPPDVTPAVQVYSEDRNGRIRLWILDNGIGIKPEHQGRLFGLFQRIHPEDKYPGTGVGLAVVRKSVERMGGCVGLESNGVGSKFWIELPASEPP